MNHISQFILYFSLLMLTCFSLQCRRSDKAENIIVYEVSGEKTAAHDVGPADDGKGPDASVMIDAVVEKRDQNETGKPVKEVRSIGVMCGHGEFCPFPSIIDLDALKLKLADDKVARDTFDELKLLITFMDGMSAESLKNLEGSDYRLERINGGQEIPDDISLLLILGPEKKFSTRDVYEIDQYLVRGGTVALFYSAFSVNINTLKAKALDLGLEGFMKHVGIRLEPTMILDQKNGFPLQGIFTHNQTTRYQTVDYPFFPVVAVTQHDHPLLKDLAQVILPFATAITPTVDALRNPDLTITTLMQTSAESYAISPTTAPDGTTGFIDVNYADQYDELKNRKPDGPLPVGVLLSGNFVSYFKGKEPPIPETRKQGKEILIPETQKLGLTKDNGTSVQKEPRKFIESGSGRFLIFGSNMGYMAYDADRFFISLDVNGLFTSKPVAEADIHQWTEVKNTISETMKKVVKLSRIAKINRQLLKNLLEWSLLPPK